MRILDLDHDSRQKSLVLKLWLKRDVRPTVTGLTVGLRKSVARNVVDQAEKQYMVAVLAHKVEVAWRVNKDVFERTRKARRITRDECAFER